MRFIRPRGLVIMLAALGAVVLVAAACRSSSGATPTAVPAPSLALTATPRLLPSPTATPALTVTSVPGLPPGVSPQLALLVQQQAFARAVGNVPAVMETFADNALYAGLGLCAQTPCVGKAAIQRAVEREVADRLQAVPAPGATLQISGNAVSARFELRSDSIKAAGVERIAGTLSFEFKGDKISAMRFAPDTTDSQTLAYLAKSAPTPVPASTPTPTPRGPGASDLLTQLAQRQVVARAVRNLPALMETFAEDATYAGLGLCAATPCLGKAAIQRQVEIEFADSLQFGPTASAAPVIAGGALSFRAEVISNSIKAAGVSRVLGTLTFEAKGDKVSAVRFTPDLTDAPTVSYLARVAATPTRSPTSTPAPNQQLALLVQQQAFARAVGNVPAIMETFAEGAIYAGFGMCAPTPCAGKGPIQREIEREVADKLQATPAAGAVPRISGNTLSARFEVRSDSIKATGVERIVGTLSFEMKADKISAMRFEPDLTDNQTVAYLAQRQG